MRSRTVLPTISALALTMAAGSALAAPFDSPDPRSLAMGGAGVAAGASANAGFLNPALLAVQHDRNRFSLGLPIIGGRVLDQGDVIDAIEDFEESDPVGRFEDALDAFNEGDMDAARQELIAAGEDLIYHFDSISDKLLHVEGKVAAVVAVPGEGLGVSVFANASVIGGAFGSFSDEDREQIQQVIDAAASDDVIPDPVDDFTSSVYASFAVLTEVGVSLAHKFDVLGGVAIGVTPKLVRVDTYNYVFVGSEIDDADIDIDQGKRSATDVNVDVGIAKDFGHGWRVGLTVKNLISREYDMAPTAIDDGAPAKFKLEPMARIGVAYRPLDWITLAADYDLTENEPAGLDSKTQYLGLGAEFSVLHALQLRLGYRRNLSDLPPDLDGVLYTAGLGFSVVGLHFDLAAAGNSEDLAGAFQFGLRF